MCLMLLGLALHALGLPYSLLVATGKIAGQNISVYAGLATFVCLALLSLRVGWGIYGIVGASLLGRTMRIAITYMLIYHYREVKEGPAL